MKEYIFDIDPQPAVRMVYSDKWKRRPAKDRYMDYKNALALLGKANGFKMGDVLGFEFFMRMPQYPTWSKKKRAAMVGTPHQQRPDLDNLIKAVKDSLTKEDSNVYEYRGASKRWAEKGKIIVRVYE